MKRSHWIILFGVVVIGGLLLLGPRPVEEREAVEEKAPLPDAEKVEEPGGASWQRIRRQSAFTTEERAEAIRLANWKANFPWKPTLARDYRFNPKQVMLRYATRPSNRNYPMTTREKQLLEHGLKYRSNTDRAAGKRHLTLKEFFEWEGRFSKPFEDFCRILEEHGFDYDPTIVFLAFSDLWNYHHRMANGGKDEHNPHRTTDSSRESLAGRLCRTDWMHLKMLSEENVPNAWKLADRLIAEVEGVLEVEQPLPFQGSLNWGSAELQALMNGAEELLVPYEGWYEKHVLREAECSGDMEIRYPPGVVPEVEAVNVRNARLTDASGDPAPYYEGMEVAIVDEDLNGEIPLRVASDGTVRLPPEEEYEAILERITPPPPPMLELSPEASR